MIKSIRLKNFQVHKDLKLDLHEGVNMIVGSSDSGKSSIIRALNWLMFNKPKGEAFVRRGEKECSVAVTIGKDKITRYKGKGENGYIINGKKLKAIKLSSAPEQVTDKLNMDEINIQNQLDTHFLLSSSSGDVASILNDTVNLDAIDRAFSHLNSIKLQAQRELKDSKAQLEIISEEIDSYGGLADLQKQIELLTSMESDLEEKQDRLDNAIELFNKISETEEKLQGYSDVDGLNKEAVALLEKIKVVERMKAEFEGELAFHDGVKNLFYQIGRNQERMKIAEQDIEREKDELDRLTGGMEFCPLCGKEMSDG